MRTILVGQKLSEADLTKVQYNIIINLQSTIITYALYHLLLMLSSFKNLANKGYSTSQLLYMCMYVFLSL